MVTQKHCFVKDSFAMMIVVGNFVPHSTLTSEWPSKRDMTGRRSDASGAPMQGNTAEMGRENGFGGERQQEAF